MALTNMAKVGTQAPFATQKACSPIRLDVDFDADGSAGYATFSTTIKAVSGLESITIVDIPPFVIAAGGVHHICFYDRSADTLYVVNPTTGALVAGGAADLSAFTDQEFIVWVQ